MSILEIRDDARVRRIVSPEGVPLPFRIAPAGDRILAFTLDVVIIHAAVIVLLIAGVIAGFSTGGIALSFAVLAGFLLRNFYFTWMEVRYAGRTPGKMKLGLRVIARDGGPLTSEAVIARNLTRDLEVFLPLMALTNPSLILPSAPAWGALVAVLWLVVLMVLPLCNQDRLRWGDIVAGTIVVKAPAPILLSDLAAEENVAEQAYKFSADELDHYGIRELQVLEDVLRDGTANPELLHKVSDRIRKKIGWPPAGAHEDPGRFLMAFYKYQRSRLEQRLLLGERRELKRGEDARGKADQRE